MSLSSVAINSADNCISLLLSSRPATPLSVPSRSSPRPLVQWWFDHLGRGSNHPLYSVVSARRFSIIDPSARPRRHSSESPSTGLKIVYLFYCLGLLIRCCASIHGHPLGCIIVWHVLVFLAKRKIAPLFHLGLAPVICYRSFHLEGSCHDQLGPELLFFLFFYPLSSRGTQPQNLLIFSLKALGPPLPH